MGQIDKINLVYGLYNFYQYGISYHEFNFIFMKKRIDRIQDVEYNQFKFIRSGEVFERDHHGWRRR